MSWSRSISGSPSSVKDAMTTWNKEQMAYDVNLSDVEKDGHQKQITAAVNAVTAIVDAVSPEKSFSGSVYGHVGADGSGNIGISLSC